MAGYTVKVVADVKQAVASLGDVDNILKNLTKVRDIVVRVPGIKTFETQVKKSTNLAIKGLKSINNNTDLISNSFKKLARASDPDAFLGTTFKTVNASAINLLETLSRTTIVLFGINAAVKTLQGTFAKFYNETIGRAERYEQQLLKTKTTLASTNDVFKNGEKITDPLEKIESISSLIDSRIDSIRKKTIELAGVTSGEVIEVFSIVASQAGQIGANLEDAENLAISFAAALGTFGLPLRQARQEITSILQGNINVDSYIAQALQINSADIQKARTEIGGITGYLQKKLQTAVAGQTLAAKTLEGVLSNIRDIYEEFGRALGEVALQPLIDGWAFVFKTLNDSLDTIKQIGREIGKIPTTIGLGIANAAGLRDQGNQAKAAQAAQDALRDIELVFMRLRSGLNEMFTQLETQLGTIIRNIVGIMALLSDGIGSLTEAVVVLGRVQIESFVGAIAQLIPILTTAVAGVSSLLRAWAFLLKMPIVQAFVRIKTTFKLLEATGVLALARIITKLVLFRKILLGTWATIKTGLAMAQTAIQTLMAWISKIIIQVSILITKLTAIGLATGVLSKKAAADLTVISANLAVMGHNAGVAGSKIQLVGMGIKGLAVAFRGLLSATLVLAAVQLAIVGIVEAMNAWQRSRDQAAKDDKLKNSIKLLDETAEKAASGGLTDLQTKLRELAMQDVMNEIDETVVKIKELEAELRKIEERRNAPDVFIDYSLDADQERTEKELAEQRKKYRELQAKLDKQNDKDRIKLEAQQKKKLEKEVAEFRKRLADDEFRYRQRLARSEVEKFRLQQQLEMRRLDAVLKKRLKNEEGASRVFLQNLNTYLSKKKQGEAEIAAREKSLQLDLADLQKEIVDYKYNTEKKIAELQKKMGQYQMEVADHKFKKARAEAEANAVGGGTYTQGNIGPTSTGPHFDIKRLDGKFFERTALDAFVSVNGGALSKGTTVPGGEYGAQRGYGKHAGWDFAFADNAKLNLKGGAEFVSSTETEHGDATIFMTPDGTKYQILHGKFKEGPKGDVGPAPEAPNFDDLKDVDPAKITSALDKLKDSMTQIKALKDELTMEDIAQTFDSITDGIFGKIDLEPLEDQLQVAKDSYQKVVEGSKALTDNQRQEIEYQAQINRKSLERKQMLDDLNADQALSEQERQTIAEAINKEYDEYIAKLGVARRTQAEILGLEQARASIARSMANVEGMTNEISDIQLENRLRMEGLSEIEVRAELKKAAILREQAEVLANSQMTPEAKAAYIAQINKEIAAVNALTKAQLAAANPIKRLYSQWKQDLEDVDGYYAQMAQTIQSELGSAMSAAIIGVIEGTSTIEDAFGQMFKNIGKAFIDMATQMIAKAIIMKVLGIFLPGAGGGMNTQNYYNPMTGLGQAGPNFGLSLGGFVDNPTAALLGEGGQSEYVIPADKMQSSMERWSQGMRGKAVVEGAAPAGGSENRSQVQALALGDASKRFSPGNNYTSTNNFNAGDAGGSDNFTVNITGEQLVFNEKNYISQDEIPGIISQASKQGEARTLRKLRMSASTRGKVGI